MCAEGFGFYLYADEAGDPGFDKDDPEFKKEGAQPFMVFSILLVEDKKSRYRINRLVRQTIADLKRLYKKKNHPMPRKLRKALDTNPEIRLRLFRRLAQKEVKCHIYAALFDKRNLKHPLPRKDGRRYALLFKTLFLSTYCTPKNQKFIHLIVDRKYHIPSLRASGDDQPANQWQRIALTRLSKKLNRNINVESLSQKQASLLIHEFRSKLAKMERKRFNQMIVRAFIKMRSRARKGIGARTKLWIYHNKDDTDILLHIPDIIANFGYKKMRLDESHTMSPRERDRQQKKKARERAQWEEAFNVLKGKVTWRKPRYLHAQRSLKG